MIIRTARFLGALALIAVSLLAMPLRVEAELLKAPLKGTIIVEDHPEDHPLINEGDMKELQKGTPLEMLVSTGIESGLNMSGDEFFSKVTKDYVVDGQVVLPRGTLVHGKVKQIAPPRWAGRDGYVISQFDYLITPDGREIPIEGNFSNRNTPLKAALKVAGRTAGYTLSGGVMGAMLVVRYGGLASVAATNGYSLAAGAAAGGVIGLGAAMIGKGKHAYIPAGSAIQVHLAEKLVLPTMTMPKAPEDQALDGLAIQILGFKVAKDPFGEPTEITLTLDITNHTPNTFNSFDICLEDELGERHYPSVFGDTGLWFKKIAPNTHTRGNMSFNVDNAKLRHWLVFFQQYTHNPVVKMVLEPDKISAAASALNAKR